MSILNEKKKGGDENTAEGWGWFYNFYVSWPNVHFRYQILGFSLFRLTAVRSLVWVDEMFSTIYTTAPSFYGKINAVCTKHKVVIYRPGARQKEGNGIATWFHEKLAVRQQVWISFSISLLHFPLSVLSVQFYFHLFHLFFPSFSFIFSVCRMFCLFSFFLNFFLSIYYDHLLSFTLFVPSFLSSLLFIYSLKVMSNTCVSCLHLNLHSSRPWAQWPFCITFHSRSSHD